MEDTDKAALALHKQHKGKIATAIKTPIVSQDDLSLAYTPGVAAPCLAIAEDEQAVWEYTNRGNTVAVVTDGSAVLGLGNIGPEAALPVMEGKAALFKTFADIDAVPICLATQNTEEIINVVTQLAPTFGGINLEDISAPRCFEIEEQLKQSLSIPVFHDDQHGTAIVVLAGLMNALKIVQKNIEDCSIVMCGAGAAGIAITKLLLSQGASDIILVDSKGIVSSHRDDLNEIKQHMRSCTNPEDRSGTVADALQGADVFIGVSKAGLLSQEMIRSMNDDAIVFAMANPMPEILPHDARSAGARVVATGRSDFPNQVNNLLAFPGVFRGAFNARSTHITEEMKLAAAHALAVYVGEPTEEHILPDPLDHGVARAVADAVRDASTAHTPAKESK